MEEEENKLLFNFDEEIKKDKMKNEISDIFSQTIHNPLQISELVTDLNKLEKKIDDFSGSEGEHISIFLAKAEMTAKIFGVNSNSESFVALLLRKLKGKALTFASQEGFFSKIPTYNVFKQEILAQFTTNDTVMGVINKLTKFKKQPNESVITFLEKIQTIVMESGKTVDEDIVKEAFVRGLGHEFYGLLHGSSVKSLKSLKKEALEIENLSSKPLSSVNEVFGVTDNNQNTYNRSRGRGSWPNYGYRNNNYNNYFRGNCYNCGRYGHRASSCRSRARGRGRGAGRGNDYSKGSNQQPQSAQINLDLNGLVNSMVQMMANQKTQTTENANDKEEGSLKE